MIALDYTVLVQIVSFLFLWFLLTRLLFRPFLGLLEERERRTEGVRAEAAALTQEAERFRAEYEGRIATARDEGGAIKQALRLEALELRGSLLAQTREEASGHLQTMREEVQRELRRARELGAREAQVIARQMVEKILGRKVG